MDPDVKARASSLLLAGDGPTATLRQLRRDFPDRPPSERWVKGLSARLRAEPSEPWRFIGAEPGEAVAVLPVLDALTRRARGWSAGITKAEARMIRRIHEATGDAPAWTTYLVARQLLLAASEEELSPTERLLVEYLAAAPWRPGRRAETAAEAAGLIPHDPEAIGETDD